MSRIAQAFGRTSSEGRSALISYVMGGDPGQDEFISYARTVLLHSDILEVGIPFSDPVADGPSIQAAGLRSLNAGTKVRSVIDWCSELSRSIPVVVMCYYNTVHRMGEEAFVSSLSQAGVCGLIVPDLPLEEGKTLRLACSRREIDHILLATPATGEVRARRIAAGTSGFLYVVSRYGTTGEGTSLPEQAVALLSAYRRISALPVAVGFGISSPDHVAQLAASGADGIVVGSAIVSRIGSGASQDELGRFLSSLRDATRRRSGLS